MNIAPALTHLKIHTNTPSGAIYDIRNLVEGKVLSPAELLYRICGMTKTFVSERVGMSAVQHLVMNAIHNKCEVEDIDAAYALALTKGTTFVTAPENQFHFAVAEAEVTSSVKSTFTTSVDVEVAIKSDGSIVKGGKQVLTEALYHKYVTIAENPMDSKQFVLFLVKELQITKACATTYKHNAKKDAEATALYVVHVLNATAPLNSQQFIDLLAAENVYTKLADALKWMTKRWLKVKA